MVNFWRTNQINMFLDYTLYYQYYFLFVLNLNLNFKLKKTFLEHTIHTFINCQKMLLIKKILIKK